MTIGMAMVDQHLQHRNLGVILCKTACLTMTNNARLKTALY